MPWYNLAGQPQQRTLTNQRWNPKRQKSFSHSAILHLWHKPNSYFPFYFNLPLILSYDYFPICYTAENIVDWLINWLEKFTVRFFFVTFFSFLFCFLSRQQSILSIFISWVARCEGDIEIPFYPSNPLQHRDVLFFFLL